MQERGQCTERRGIMPTRRASISLKRSPALRAERVILENTKLVYVLVADRYLQYPWGRSRIAYIGTTKNGGNRVAASVATKASDILSSHGVLAFEARIITCRPRQRVKMWRKLERALLLEFRSRFGEVPRCNSQGKGFTESGEFDLFSRERVRKVVLALS